MEHIVKIGRYYKKLMVLDEIMDLKNRFKITNFDMLYKKIGWGVSKNERHERFPI